MKKKYLLKRLWLLLAFPLTLLISWLAAAFPHWVDSWYAAWLYPGLSQTVNRLSNTVPFSVAELLLAAVVAGVLIYLVVLLRHMFDKRLDRLFILYQGAVNLGIFASLLYLVFVLFCGVNYHRTPFSTYSGLELRPSSVQELSGLCEELIARANTLREQVGEENGVMALNQTIQGTGEEAARCMELLSQDYPVLAGEYGKPKPVLLSPLMSYTQITGFFFPYTFEANINTAAPEYTIPATMCHELSHLRGFMREDEANFLAYLACCLSDNMDVEYSGVMLALVHSMNSLYSADYETFCLLAAKYAPGVQRDFQYNSQYWAAHEGTVSKVSETVNDTYLKVNSQTDGVKSYGRMVDLLLADYRVRHNIP